MTVVRAELVKLAAQTRLRVLVLTCLLGPVLAAAVLGAASGSPKDTLFGRHLHESGFALPLVILGFAGTWGFPLLTSLVAGDIFSAEDAHRTWPALLTRSRTRLAILHGKVLASCLVAAALLAVTAVSSLLAGLALAGDGPLVDLSGRPMTAGSAAVAVLASWASCLPPLLGFTSLACLLSLASRSSMVGVVGPVLIGLVMELLDLVGGLGSAANVLLTTPFSAWHGLVRSAPFYGPFWQGALVSAAWAVGGYLPARRLLLARDFT